MEQIHSTQFVHHEILYEDRQQALRGCDGRTYALLCRRRLEEGPRGGRAGILDRLAKALRIVQRRQGHTGQMQETPDSPAEDAAPVVPQGEPVVCIDLGNPLVGASKSTSSPLHRSDGDRPITEGTDL